jgi:3-phenylpropionate/trans-cinnamate dioxygenase ferredoxin reductase subunit
MLEHVVIVGGGQAAAQAIQTLRQKNFAGRITLCGEETDLPYQRPPLSKKYLAGDLTRDRLYIRPQAFYAELDVELVLGRRVTALEPASQRVTLQDGKVLEYDGLLLATGSRVRKLDTAGSTLEGIHYLRTLQDVDAILAGFPHAKRLVIVGAGYIGLEVAAVARQRGLDVSILELSGRVMPRVVCPAVSAFYHDLHTAAGSEIHYGVEVNAFEGHRRVSAVIGSDGGRYPCDIVIVGIGVVPATELAEAAGLDCNNGIVVDECARTTQAHIVAAGDCTLHPNPILGRRVRLESVPNAIEQAKTAAMSLLGHDEPYSQVPWFWSDQFDVKLQIAGLSEPDDTVVIRGDVHDRGFAAYYLQAERLVAVNAINSPKDFLRGKQLIAACATLDAEALADAAADLCDAVVAAPQSSSRA